jgi:hypothetical protein
VALLGAIVVAGVVLAGLALFWGRYRGARAGLPLLAAFGLGLLTVVPNPVIQATASPDDEPPVAVIFMTHLTISLASLLLLGGIVSLRDLPNASFGKLETVSGWVLAAVAVTAYAAAAWWRLPQDDVNCLVITVVPLLMAIAVLGRFGRQPDGLLGGGVFLALFGSDLLFFFIRKDPPESPVPIVIASSVQVAAYLGMLSGVVRQQQIGNTARVTTTRLQCGQARRRGIWLRIAGLARSTQCHGDATPENEEHDGDRSTHPRASVHS